jgi:predicted dehydrogenase
MSEVDRRRFLRVAGSVVATVAASASTVRAVAKPIRVGVFGTQHGHVNSKMRALRANSDYEVVAVHEPDEGARKKRQSEKLFEGLKFIAEDDLLGDNSLDLIMVEGRVWQAIPWGNKVIDAGRHLHLEKPPSPDLEPFRQLIEKAKRKKLLLQQGYNYRYHPCIRAAIEATKKGWLGDAYLLRATMNSNRSKQGRTIEAKYPGGAFFELCGHMVDRAVELWGRPLKTTGFLRHDTSEPDDLKDNTLAVLEYDKSMAVISTAAKMANAGAHRSFELIGTEGSFFIQPIAGDRTMRVNMSKARGPYKEGWQDIKFEPHPYDKFEFEDMARAIRTREPLEYSYDHELLVHETLLRASGHIT